MRCPVHHNWLGVAGAVFLVLEITEVAETTDNRGERRRGGCGWLTRVARDSSSRLLPAATCSCFHSFASASPRLRGDP